jgi:hypothetical protein
VKLTISIDNMSAQIDSTDPELLGKWVMEIFGRAVVAGITPATMIQMQVYPSWIPDPNSPHGGGPDWIADTRIIGRVYQIRSWRDLLDELRNQIEEAEALNV